MKFRYANAIQFLPSVFIIPFNGCLHDLNTSVRSLNYRSRKYLYADGVIPYILLPPVETGGYSKSTPVGVGISKWYSSPPPLILSFPPLYPSIIFSRPLVRLSSCHFSPSVPPSFQSFLSLRHSSIPPTAP